MNVHRLGNSALVWAPAKVNLFFEVLAKRSDGYHEIETLMVPIGLYDTLTAYDDPTGRVRVDCCWAIGIRNSKVAFGELPSQEQNLATRAIELLRRRAKITSGISVELTKRIPSAAGLGGGSSDAAAAMLAANLVWNLGWTREALAALGAELGSDVPFFFGSTAAVCRGRGERIEAVAGTGEMHLVVVRPPEGLSTPKVYANCRVPERPRSVTPLVDALRSGDTRHIGQLIHNRLESAARELSPWIGRLHDELSAEDCLAAQLSGSGSAYFGICRHARHARRVARRLQARDIGHVIAVSTCN